MTTRGLRATVFAGDADVEELHGFFLPERQFAGDALWTFGTSLKSAYVNSFEFMNHAPIVQLWRDEADTVQAVSRLSLGTGEWFHQAAPTFRQREVTEVMVRQADTAFALLTDRTAWHTVRYESNTAEIELLGDLGYVSDGIAEVFMVRSLKDPIEPPATGPGLEVGVLSLTDVRQVHERALAQVDAFSDGEPTALETAWITRSLPHQLGYGRPNNHPGVIAVDGTGTVLAFADFFIDNDNRIGEFEPVGTRKSSRRRGLGKAVTARALQEIRDLGSTQAIVRTGHDNHAAIATYESVGFETTDLLIRFRRDR